MMNNGNFQKVGFMLLLFAFIFPNLSFGQETKVMIRAQSKDAKFIGTSIGGAKVIIRDAVSGEILAQGLTEGSTGETKRIMQEPQTRGKQLADENTAGFLAVLDLDAPTFVEVEVIAPFNKRQARVTSSTQLWLIPGKDIMGDGLVLEVPGFVIDILSPQTHERIASSEEIKISANVVMMCGCPITEGGLWDAAQYEVTAMIVTEGEETKIVELELQEKASTFSGKISLSPGNYGITVYAYDPLTGNTGLDKTNIIIQ